MGKRRGLDGGSERVARIAGAGILMPGVDMRDLIKEMQAELDQLAPKASSKTPPKHFYATLRRPSWPLAPRYTALPIGQRTEPR